MWNEKTYYDVFPYFEQKNQNKHHYTLEQHSYQDLE